MHVEFLCTGGMNTISLWMILSKNEIESGKQYSENNYFKNLFLRKNINYCLYWNVLKHSYHFYNFYHNIFKCECLDISHLKYYVERQIENFYYRSVFVIR